MVVTFKFPFLPLESIQSHFPGLYTPYTERTSKIFPTRRMRVDNTVDNADITQSQAANYHRLLSHVTLGLVECRK